MRREELQSRSGKCFANGPMSKRHVQVVLMGDAELHFNWLIVSTAFKKITNDMWCPHTFGLNVRF